MWQSKYFVVFSIVLCLIFCSVRSRLGFQQGSGTFNRTAAGIRRPPTVKPFGQARIGPFAKPYDARQKLQPRSAGGAIGRTLGSGRVVGMQPPGHANNVTTLHTTKPSDVVNYAVLQKTKFADARQRIEMKKQQLTNRGDARMKLLAKRRFSAPEDSNAKEQPQLAMQITTFSDSQKSSGLVQPPANATTRPMLVTLSAQGRVARPVGAESSVVAAGGTIKKTVGFGSQQSQQPSVRVTVSGGSLRRTFSAQSRPQSASSVIVLCTNS
jgi:hypothetical protein